MRRSPPFTAISTDAPDEERSPPVLTSTFTARARSGAAALLIAAAIFGSAASPALADDVDGVGASPAADGAADQTRSRFSYQVEPGQTISDEYLVVNTGTTAQQVTVYATDAFNNDDGNFDLLGAAEAPTDAGSWVTFEGGVGRLVLDLLPEESRIVPFTVTVPADAAPGDHAGGIIASALSDSGQISLDRRVGVRLYVRVKGELQPSLSVSSMTASYEGSLNPFAGEVTMTMTVRNAGNVAMGATTINNVRGLFGIPLSGDVNIEIPELLPGTSRTVTTVVPGVGPWLLLSPHMSLVATIDDNAFNPGPLPRAERENTLFAVPWALLMLILVAAVVTAVVRIRRRANDRKAQEWMEYTEAEARRTAREEEERLAREAEVAEASKPVPAKSVPAKRAPAKKKPVAAAASEK